MSMKKVNLNYQFYCDILKTVHCGISKNIILNLHGIMELGQNNCPCVTQLKENNTPLKPVMSVSS